MTGCPGGATGAADPSVAPQVPVGSELVLIAMVAANGVIGDGADQPWHLRDDQRRFARLTRGHPILMGRRTWAAIGTALPGRSTVVLTRDPAWSAPGAIGVADPQKALDIAATLPGGDQIWVIGGGQVYAALLGSADRIELTEVDADAAGDTTFPRLTTTDWVETDRDDRCGFAFVTYRPRAGRTDGDPAWPARPGRTSNVAADRRRDAARQQ